MQAILLFLIAAVSVFLFGAMPTLFVGVALFSVYAYVAPRLSAKKAEAVNINYTRTMSAPVLVRSNFPGDATVSARADMLKWAISESGNTWKPPVITVPYNGRPEYQGTPGKKTAEAIQSFSTFALPWHEYELICNALYKTALDEWQRDMETKHGTDTVNRVMTAQKTGPATWSWGDFSANTV